MNIEAFYRNDDDKRDQHFRLSQLSRFPGERLKTCFVIASTENP